MRKIARFGKHRCSFFVVAATLAMLAVMLVPLFLFTGFTGTGDFNENGLEDARDLVIGARKAVEANPVYNGNYVKGYPPETAGACTDIIWRAFKEAGYALRDMVDADIKANPAAYPNVRVRDRDTDYRRVVNLHGFFARHAVTLTTDLSDRAAWQPGDIVIFKKDRHIGILSDRTNADGLPLVIHHSSDAAEEADYLPTTEVTAHFRFDPDRLPEWLAVRWYD